MQLSEKVFNDPTTKDLSWDEWQKIKFKLCTTKEELLPELKECVRDGYIKHPLLVAPALENADSNYMLLARRRRAEELLEAKNYIEYVEFHESPFRTTALFEMADRITDDAEYWQTVASVYVMIENQWEHPEKWKQLFSSDRPKREMMMNDKEREFFDSLPDVITIYRGYSLGELREGWSWTLKRETAQWFADRYVILDPYESCPEVITAKAEKSKVLAYFNDRDEEEIVVDFANVIIQERPKRNIPLAKKPKRKAVKKKQN